jgi:hypothetical protein
MDIDLPFCNCASAVESWKQGSPWWKLVRSLPPFLNDMIPIVVIGCTFAIILEIVKVNPPSCLVSIVLFSAFMLRLS